MRGFLVIALVAGLLACMGQASAASRPWTGRYTVRAGDSLTMIAKRYAVPFQTLAEVNGLDWRRPLLIGVVLRVPSGRSAIASPAAIYVVHVGDTLSGIALRYHVSLAQLASANRIDPAGVLLAGARLRIPGATGAQFSLAHIFESDPYRSGAVGYDFSYPNCDTRVPASPTFAVIGLNLGRPFTANPCFAREWAAAQRPRSVYINTAYSNVLLRHVTPSCSAAGSAQPLTPAGQRAYAVGCSEAEADLQLLAASPPLAIWLDVEPGNTWSSRRSLNAATIKGIIERLLGQAGHPAIGVYSNAAFWRSIVGRWSSLSVPEWVATGAPDPPGCPAGFAAGPVWLSQSTDGRLDTDKAC
jgi:LysM repeat protein